MSKQALIIIDVQNDYFPGGKWTLDKIDEAATNVQRILSDARDKGMSIFHVHHEFNIEGAPFFEAGTHGAEIHSSATPIEGEKKILKHQVNSFLETNLKALLESESATDLTIVGAMSHMCVDSAVRAAADFGYNVTVVEDACASRDLEFNCKTVPAAQVHAAFMAAIDSTFASVTTTDKYLG